jgi:hypothetical protein
MHGRVTGLELHGAMLTLGSYQQVKHSASGLFMDPDPRAPLASVATLALGSAYGRAFLRLAGSHLTLVMADTS